MSRSPSTSATWSTASTRAAPEHDATSQLAPGVRPDHHPGYFDGFLLDPDGINLEAVCHRAG